MSSEAPLRMGYIYIIKSGNAYKVGKTRNLQQRLKTYITENPQEITLVFACLVVGYDQMETILHKRFGLRRIHGEWFDLDVEAIQDAMEMLTQWAKNTLEELSKAQTTAPCRAPMMR